MKRSASDARGAWGYIIMTVPKSRHEAVREAQHLVGEEIERQLESIRERLGQELTAKSSTVSARSIENSSSNDDILAELAGELQQMKDVGTTAVRGMADRLARLRWLDTGARGIELLVS